LGILHFSFFSEILRSESRVSLILPKLAGSDTEVRPGFGRTAVFAYLKGRKYQTLYLLHGGGGDCTDYIRSSQIDMFAEEHELAVVMPEVDYCYYADMKHGKEYYTYLTEEVPVVMESVFPLTRSRDHRFVAGVSMGSYGAYKWALSCPEFFAAAAGISGVCDFVELQRTVRPNHDPKANNYINNAFGSLEEMKNSGNDLVFLLTTAASKGGYLPRLYSACGTEDFTYDYCKDYIGLAKKLGIDIHYDEGPGAHEWRFFNTYIERAINWMPLTKEPLYL
jgi:S-formylglutathione hydrolase FrmB